MTYLDNICTGCHDIQPTDLEQATCKWKESMNNLKHKFFAGQEWKPADSKCCHNHKTQTQQPPYPNNHISNTLQ